MKQKKSKSPLLIAIFTIAVCLFAIFSFVPMQFGDTLYTGVWGNIGISSNVYGGVYAEYDIVGEATTAEISSSMEKIKNLLNEQGYQSSNVLSIDGKKLRVEIGYSSTTEFSQKNAKSNLEKVATGEFAFRSVSDISGGDTGVSVLGKSHIKNIIVADYNGKTLLTFEMNEEGEKKFEELCGASQTVYVYMGGTSSVTSFSVSSSNANYKQVQLTVSDYNSAKDFYYRAMYGSIDIKLSASDVGYSMSALFGNGYAKTSSTILVELVILIFLLLVAGFVYVAIKFGIAAILLLPIMLFNGVIACWIFTGISIFEINISSLISIILGISVILGGSIYYLGRIAEEYKLGKTMEASVEAGTKKARPVLIITSAIMVAIFAVFTMISSGELACASVVMTLCGALNFLTNFVLLPWFVSSYNKTNTKQGKPFRLKYTGDNADEK